MNPNKPKANEIIIPTSKFGSPPVGIQMPSTQAPEVTPVVFYIYDDIGDPDHYIEFISMLEQASKEDTFIIRLNTTGGSLWTCVSLVNAILETEAHTVGVADGIVASAGTFILMACKEVQFSDYSACMMHDGSDGMGGGKFSESKKAITAISMLYERLAKDIYSPYFTDEEIQKILAGEDFWCLYDEMRERYATVEFMNGEPEEVQLLNE